MFFCSQRSVAIQYKIEIYGQSMLCGSPPTKNLVQILHHLLLVFLFFNLVSNNTFFDNSQDPRSRHISRQRKWRASFCPEVATEIHGPPWRASAGLGLSFFEPTDGVLLVLTLSNHNPNGWEQEQFFNMLMVFERILSRNIPSKGVCCQIKLCKFSILTGAQKLWAHSESPFFEVIHEVIVRLFGGEFCDIEVLWPRAAAHADYVDCNKAEVFAQMLSKYSKSRPRLRVSVYKYQDRLCLIPKNNCPDWNIYIVMLADKNVFCLYLVLGEPRLHKNIPFTNL